MDSKSKKALVTLGVGGAAIYALSKILGTSAGSGGSSDGSINLSDLMSGLTDTVGSLTGSLQENFVTIMTPIADQIHQTYGVQPIITITQAAHESGWGASGLTKKANNLYGYTFSDSQMNAWLASKGMAANTDMGTIRSLDLSAAPFIILQTHEEVSGKPITYFSRPGDLVSQDGTDALVYRPFRRYDSWLSSVTDWVNLLKGNSRYAAAWGDALSGDVDAFAQDIYAGGYATDSTYPSQIIKVAGEVGAIAPDIQSA